MDKETEAKIKKIWKQFKDSKTLYKIYLEELSPFFDVEHWTKTSSEWLLFLGMAGRWKKEDTTARIEKDTEEMTDEQIIKIQESNRRRTILMLREILSAYEQNPKKFKTISITEVRKWYKTIQSMEESMKRTHIARGKLKLDAVRTLMPYNQLVAMPPDKLKELRKQVNDSFDRILQLRSGTEGGPVITPIG